MVVSRFPEVYIAFANRTVLTFFPETVLLESNDRSKMRQSVTFLSAGCLIEMSDSADRIWKTDRTVRVK
jgi:hypothetical protein